MSGHWKDIEAGLCYFFVALLILAGWIGDGPWWQHAIFIVPLVGYLVWLSLKADRPAKKQR